MSNVGLGIFPCCSNLVLVLSLLRHGEVFTISDLQDLDDIGLSGRVPLWDLIFYRYVRRLP